MARGLIVSSQNKMTSHLLLTSISRVSSPTKLGKNFFMPNHLQSSPSIPSYRLLCSCSNDPIDMSKYRETFSKRMAMAGLKPHHRIALGVSGGPDSMALCVLAAGWKTSCLNVPRGENSIFIDGLLAIVVNHALRTESKDEANDVSRRVLHMGIRCEIANCEWSDGRPKQGHLQEAAREMRYQIFHNVCIQHQIGVLLIAHHADDQAELFILRLSRNSGVIGLAGMAFASQIFSTYPKFNGEVSNGHGILLVRPLLEFSKGDMYKICQGGNQEWVEDPTNQSPSFARNRIRMSLKNLSSSSLNSELQAVISACRRTRSYIERVCYNLIHKAVTIMDQGYAVIDLKILNPSKVEDLCLSKFVTSVLQFISQRRRPVRGSASKLLLNYLRTFPCKTSLTAAGCYLCAAPGSKGTKVLVCCSIDSSLPLKMELFHEHSYEVQKHFYPTEVEQIIAHETSYSDCLVPDASDVQFLDVTSSESVLLEAKRINILSDLTHRIILSLRRDEIEHFKSKTGVKSDFELKNEIESASTSLSKVVLQPGHIGYFMNRFLVTWKLRENIINDTCSLNEANFDQDLGAESPKICCRSCPVSHDMTAEVRCMIDADWLYLAELSKCQNVESSQKQGVLLAEKMEQTTEKSNACSDYVKLSAQGALQSLKSIPVAARRGLPVLVNPQGLLLNIPSICFDHCPCLMASAVFKPRIPLGGGHSWFI